MELSVLFIPVEESSAPSVVDDLSVPTINVEINFASLNDNAKHP